MPRSQPALRRRRSHVIALAAVAASLAAAPRAEAVDYYWKGGTYDNWSQYAWNDGVTGDFIGTGIFHTDDLYFGYSGPLDANGRTHIDYMRDFSISSLNFANQSWELNGDNGDAYLDFLNGNINVLATSPSVDIFYDLGLPHNYLGDPGSLTTNVATGSRLRLTGVYGNGSLNKNGGGTLYMTNGHNYDLGTFINGGLLIDSRPNGNYTINSALEFEIMGGDNQTLAGSVAGAGTLTKSGGGTLYLTGSVGYTGNTTINDGRLVLQLPYSRNINLAGFYGSLETTLTQTQNVTYSGRMTGVGYYVKSGAGTMTLTGPNDYTGGTIIEAGTLTDKNPHGDYRNSGNLTLDVDGTGNGVTAGSVSGSGSTFKTGAGTLTLTSTGTGSTTVNGGRLIVQNPSGTYNNSAALEFRTATDQTFAGGILNANVLNLSPGTLTKSGAGTLTLSAQYNPSDPVSPYTGGTIVNEGRLIEQSPHGDYVTNAELEFANARNVDFWTPASGGGQTPNRISGTGNFTKSGAGTLALFAPSTYAGKTTVNGGTLLSLGANYLPTTTALTVNANGTLVLGGAQTVTTLSGTGKITTGGPLTVNGGTGSAGTVFSGVISGTGSLTKTGGGVLDLQGVNTYTGTTTVNGGILSDANPHGTYVTNAALWFAPATDLDYATPITGTGSFTKSGAGTLTLSGVNTYSGSTTALLGRLIEMNPHGNYVTRAALEFARPGDYGYANAITGAGSFTKSGAGTLTLSGANTYTGGTTLSTGRLIDLNPHGDYVTNADLEFANAGTVQFATPVPVGPATPNRISGTGNFTKSGGGELLLSAPSTYAGTTTINGGTLTSSGANLLPATTALTVNANGTFNLGGTQTVASLAGAGKVTMGGALTVNSSASKTFSGVASGAGSLTKAGEGTLTLSGVNTYTGGTTVNAGWLVDTNPHGSYVTNANLAFAPNVPAIYAGAINGSGTFTKAGASTIELSGASTYTGGTTVSEGTLRVSGTIVGDLTTAPRTIFINSNSAGLNLGAGTLDGTVTTFSSTRFSGPVTGSGSFLASGKVEFDGGYSPGSLFGSRLASVAFDGDLTLGATNTLTMELGGTVPGTGYDRLTIEGLATLGGSLNVVSLSGFTPSSGQSFDLFDFKFRPSVGTFSAVNLPGLGTNLSWDTSALYSTGTIRVQSVPEPATMLSLSLGALAVLRRKRAAAKRAS